MSGVEDVRAVAVTFNTETVGAGMNVASIAEAINQALEGRVYLGHIAIRRTEMSDQLKGPDGIILLVAPAEE